MATIAEPIAAQSGREERLFFRLALAIAATAVIGFGLNTALGRVDIPRVPWWVHLHGIANMGWVLLLVVQSHLVRRGTLALHRRLGWFGLALLIAMVTLGLVSTVMSIKLGRAPPFFTPPYFLMLAGLVILATGGLAGAAIAMRRRTDWHRRLMIGASISLIEPALGRLVPAPMLGDWLAWAVWPLQLLFFLPLVLHDIRSRGSVHPATLWGVGVLTATVAAMIPLSQTAMVQGWAAALAG